MKVLTIVLLLAASLGAQESATAAHNETTFGFPAGGSLRLELGAGDAEVIGWDQDKIVVTYTTKKPEQSKDVRIEGDMHGSSGTVRVHGPRNNFHYTIHLPSRTDLYLRMSGGDLEVKGISGDKDIQSHAGDLTVEIGDANQYGPIDASVKMGDLDLPALGVSKGGIGRSYKTSRGGKYRLHVHLGAGDLTLR
jgi:hypothetical protein